MTKERRRVIEKITVCLLTCAFSAIMIAELSSALIIQSHSQKIQINEEDTLELGIKTLINWFFRQVVFGIFQPIIDTYFPRIFKKTALSSRHRFSFNRPSKYQCCSRPYRQVRSGWVPLYHPNPRDRTALYQRSLSGCVISTSIPSESILKLLPESQDHL